MFDKTNIVIFVPDETNILILISVVIKLTNVLVIISSQLRLGDGMIHQYTRQNAMFALQTTLLMSIIICSHVTFKECRKSNLKPYFYINRLN